MGLPIIDLKLTIECAPLPEWIFIKMDIEYRGRISPSGGLP
jgi:hypothetical protein